MNAGWIPHWHASLNLNSGGIGMELQNSTLFGGGSSKWNIPDSFQTQFQCPILVPCHWT